MSAWRHVFYSVVVQVPTRRRIPSNLGSIRVKVHLFKETRFVFDDPEDYESDDLTFVAGEEFLNSRERLRDMVAEKLSEMPIPEKEALAIVEKLVQKLSVVSDVHIPLPFTVLIFDIIVSLLGSADYNHVKEYIAEQTILYSGHRIIGGEVVEVIEEIEESIAGFAAYKPNLTPATRSFIHGLKKSRLNSLKEAVIGENPCCAICIQDFAESCERLVTCLPCRHHYHVNCIVLWLEINHRCPLCRYPMPTVEAGEPLTDAAAN